LTSRGPTAEARGEVVGVGASGRRRAARRGAAGSDAVARIVVAVQRGRGVAYSDRRRLSSRNGDLERCVKQRMRR
jgi:hypothetical protein